MTSLVTILLAFLGVVRLVIFIHIILSWLLNFDVINLRQPIVAQIWYALSNLLEPAYRRIRSFMPNLGGIDLAPLVALFGVFALEVIIRNNAHYLGA